MKATHVDTIRETCKLAIRELNDERAQRAHSDYVEGNYAGQIAAYSHILQRTNRLQEPTVDEETIWLEAIEA